VYRIDPVFVKENWQAIFFLDISMPFNYRFNYRGQKRLVYTPFVNRKGDLVMVLAKIDLFPLNLIRYNELV